MKSGNQGENGCLQVRANLLRDKDKMDCEANKLVKVADILEKRKSEKQIQHFNILYYISFFGI